MLRAISWRGWLASLITAACLVVLVRSVNLSELERAALQAHFGLLGVAILISAGTVIAKGLRWSALYPTWARPSPVLAVSGVAAGQVANWAVPWRLGELLRVGLAATTDARLRGRSLAAGTGVLVAEKTLDAAMLLMTVAIMVVVVGVPAWLSATAIVASLVFCGAGLGIALRLRPERAPRWLVSARTRLIRLLPPAAARILEDTSGLTEGLSSWLTTRDAITALGWTLCAWALGALINYIVFSSVGINPQPVAGAALAVLAAVYGAAVVPTLPGRLGVFQYVCVVALSPFGIQVEQAIIFSVGLYLAVYIPPIVIGLASLLVLGRAHPEAATAPTERQPV